MWFKPVRLMAIRYGPKQTISASSEFRLLQMVSELGTKQCASEDVGPQRGWIVISHNGWRGKQNIFL